MKQRILNTASLALMLSLLPLAGVGVAGAAEPSTDPSDAALAGTDSLPASPPDVPLSGPVAEVVKLANAGVSEAVMLSFVNNSADAFNLGSQQIIYLNDLGVSDSVINAMIQRDQALKGSASYTTSTAGSDIIDLPSATESATTVSPSPPPDQPAPTIVDNSYFENSLSPYGTWVQVGDYGRCWQPTVVVLNRGWQPYGDRGHWIYTDCGWYWHSDYTWGSVAFHYGRWINDPHFGWCWWPDSTWGPAWVTWRYDNDYCGWAPLSPAARFNFSVGLTFSTDFGGIGANCYTFVPWGSFNDPRPYRHRLSGNQLVAVYHGARPVNDIEADNHHRVFNRGIAPERVTGFTHQAVPHYTIRDQDPHGAGMHREQIDRANRTVFESRPPIHEGTTPPPGNRTQFDSRAPRQGNFTPAPGNRTQFDSRAPNKEGTFAPTSADGPANRTQFDSRPNGQEGLFTPPPPDNPTATKPSWSDRIDHSRSSGSSPQANHPAATPAVPAPAENPSVIVIGKRQTQPRQVDNRVSPAPSDTPAPAARTFTPQKRNDPVRNVQTPAPAPAPRFVSPNPSYSPPPRPSYTPPPAPPAPRQENRAPAYSPPPPPPAAAPAPAPAPASEPNSGRQGQNRKEKDR